MHVMYDKTGAKVPLVSKRYDIRLPIGKPCNKKIMYTNPYSSDKVFRLRTDQVRGISLGGYMLTLVKNMYIILHNSDWALHLCTDMSV